MTDPMRNRAFDKSYWSGQPSDGPVDVWVDDIDDDIEDATVSVSGIPGGRGGEFSGLLLAERLMFLPLAPLAGVPERAPREALVPERAAPEQ